MCAITESYFFKVVAFFTTVLCIWVAYVFRCFKYWERRNFPHLKPTFPFGTIGNLLSNEKSIGDRVYDAYNELKRRNWKHAGMYFLSTKFYMVRDMDYVKNVMATDFNYFTDRGIYYNEEDTPVDANLFKIGGEKWRNLRRKLTPTFTSQKMKTMLHILLECGHILEKNIEKKTKTKETLDIKDILGHFTTDIIGSVAFGLNCDSFQNSNSPFRVYGKKLITSTKFIMLKNFFGNAYPNFSKKIGLCVVSKDINNFYSKIVRDTIKRREETNEIRNDFLQILMELKSDNEEYKGDGNTLTMNEIIAECFIFFVAGFETSSTTMTFILYELSQHQDIQDKVRKEINEVLEKHGNQITFESLKEMKYMQQVIDETLRYYPPLAFITRLCVQDYKIPDEDLVLEKGTTVHISVKGMHHDERYYKNPSKFDPERFSEENKKKIHQYAYLPFGEGNRKCIGMRFGLMQTKVGLIVLLRKYRFTTNKKTTVPLKMSHEGMFQSAKGGIWLDTEEISN